MLQLGQFQLRCLFADNFHTTPPPPSGRELGVRVIRKNMHMENPSGKLNINRQVKLTKVCCTEHAARKNQFVCGFLSPHREPSAHLPPLKRVYLLSCLSTGNTLQNGLLCVSSCLRDLPCRFFSLGFCHVFALKIWKWKIMKISLA